MNNPDKQNFLRPLIMAGLTQTEQMRAYQEENNLRQTVRWLERPQNTHKYTSNAAGHRG